jgi:hypothetical protein
VQMGPRAHQRRDVGCVDSAALVACFAFTPSVVLVNHSVPKQHFGAANGFTQSCGTCSHQAWLSASSFVYGG